MGVVLYIQDFKIQASNLGCLAQRNAILRFSNMNFGACSGHLRAADGGMIIGDGSYAISGVAGSHWAATASGRIRVQSRTITLTGTPAISTFAAADTLGVMVVNGNTFSGAATGTRYSVTSNAVINTVGAGATYFPGDVSGATGTGGQYV